MTSKFVDSGAVQAPQAVLPTQPERDNYMLSELAQRGWTKTMIMRLLGAPDQIKGNPYSKKSAPIKLYAKKRVHAAEATTEFADLEAKALIRRTVRAKVTQSQRAKLLEEVQALEINLPELALPEVEAAAIHHYNAYQKWKAMQRGDWLWMPAGRDSDRDFLDRITVNYIRHQLTRYDETLLQLFGKVGVDVARLELRRRIYAEIGAKFPTLQAEAQRQMIRRGLVVG